MKNASIKETGATFTPPGLATFLAQKLMEHLKVGDNKILDPACGDGALLSAIGDELSNFNKGFTLFGFDINQQYLDKSQFLLSKFDDDMIQLKLGDFLGEIEMPVDQLDLFGQVNPDNLSNKFDAVIANPPYVRTQIIGSTAAQLISKKYGLTGRVDLYYPFLLAMTASLKENGIIAVITSNRYLVTKSGEEIKKFLAKNYEIIEVIDLGDTKLFDAAVLPAIFIGRKCSQTGQQSVAFTKIYESPNSEEIPAKSGDFFEVLKNGKGGLFSINGKNYKKSVGKIEITNQDRSKWLLLADDESDWVKKIQAVSCSVVKDWFKVRVGIKTTADKVFISDKWDKLGVDKPEASLLKTLISQENISAWQNLPNSDLKVLYPYIFDPKTTNRATVDLNQFPKTEKYLIEHESQLKSRKYVMDSGREWFEIWVPHRPSNWLLPKLVFPDISNKPRFCFDESGSIVNGNCYWISANGPQEVDKLLLIQGVANSNLMSKYHDLMFNNKLYSGRRRYFSQYVENYPIPPLDSRWSQQIISLVKQLNSMSNMEHAHRTLIIELEIAVANAFGVDPVIALG